MTGSATTVGAAISCGGDRRMEEVGCLMAIFVILLPELQPQLAEKIVQTFPQDHFKLSDLQWIISSSFSVIDLTAKLGIYNPIEPDAVSSGNAVIFSVLSYYGLGPNTLWDWLRTKQEGRVVA